MIELEFSYRGGLAGRLVQRATWSWCSHVDFVLPDGQLLGAVPGVGVSVRPWTAAQRAERYRLPGDDAVLRAALGQVGAPYDWCGVLGLGVHRDWQDSGAWFCSELVAWAFAIGDVPLLRTSRVGRITPRDLLLCPYLVGAEVTALMPESGTVVTAPCVPSLSDGTAGAQDRGF